MFTGDVKYVYLPLPPLPNDGLVCCRKYMCKRCFDVYHRAYKSDVSLSTPVYNYCCHLFKMMPKHWASPVCEEWY